MFTEKRSKPLILLILVSFLISTGAYGASHRGGHKRDRVARDFRHMDVNSDGEISPAEWNRRGNFKRLDTNGSGSLDSSEVRAMYGHSLPEYRPSSTSARADRITTAIDPSALDDQVGVEELDELTVCGVTRSRGCDPFDAVKLGMRPTGLGPRFPEALHCHGIDDYWALDYSYKRNRPAWHGGIDMPADWGTAILAVADGSVVAVFSGEHSKRGMEVIIRHSPEQTGIPYWTYSGYGHLDALPPFELGQTIKKGQIIGPTGNSGLGARGGRQSTRRAAIHFSVLYSDSPEYAILDGELIPKNGHWMDPVGFYRQAPPYESRALKALPDSEKYVDIPVMTQASKIVPTGAQRIWPYACRPEGESSSNQPTSGSQSLFDF